LTEAYPSISDTFELRESKEAFVLELADINLVMFALAAKKLLLALGICNRSSKII